jgi:hypothetical protein
MTGKEYMALVARLPCIACTLEDLPQSGRAEVHHLGAAFERNDFLTCPLCLEHHQGGTGIHGMHRKAFHTRYKITDMQMLAWTIARVMSLTR